MIRVFENRLNIKRAVQVILNCCPIRKVIDSRTSESEVPPDLSFSVVGH